MHFLPNLRFVFYLDSIYFLTVNGFKWACPLVPCNPYDILEILNVSALIDSFLYILFFGIFGHFSLLFSFSRGSPLDWYYTPSYTSNLFTFK